MTNWTCPTVEESTSIQWVNDLTYEDFHVGGFSVLWDTEYQHTMSKQGSESVIVLFPLECNCL